MKAQDIESNPKTAKQWPSLSVLLANWRARQGLKDLLAADDWLLKDIGLTRNEVAWAMRLPLSVNAGEELNRIAKRGRAWRPTGRTNRRRDGEAGVAPEQTGKEAAKTHQASSGPAAGSVPVHANAPAPAQAPVAPAQRTAARYPRKQVPC
ncbi:DUF1127 domain-containing protein [Rhodoligotrophos defluvii]|uniref:DUF1127 domain-containing protein n=1 Tax=Rhodoligotrophos defluvii TaxID=2561934 RepID=UPI00196128CE|nr:DUF1127 domain-containing protein [Rhodoligotrophos defluvii]